MSAVRCVAKRSACLAGALVLVGAGAPTRAAEPARPPQVEAGASAPVRAWRRAMEAGDLAALARMHDATTVAYPPDKMRVEGADAIMAGYAGLFAKYTIRVTIEDAHWIAQPPLVVSWGLTTLTLHPKAGGPDVVSHTRFTDAAIAVDGGWRYVVDHASVPAAPSKPDTSKPDTSKPDTSKP